MHAADLIVAVSQAIRRQLIEQFAVAPEKVCVIYNGVRTENWPARGPRGQGAAPLAVFAGRVTYQKGPHYFVQAAHRLRARHPGLRFVVAGVGDMLESTIALVSELGMADRFSFPGFLDRASLHGLFAQADVFVMPSLSEPFGIVALEAIAASVPVVMSCRAGVAEVITSAYKVEPWDIDAIAAAMDATLNDAASAARMANAARHEAQGWDWTRAATALAAQYARKIEQAGNARRELVPAE
jgi:glycogen(starch) synthase